jgi:hypothetical protein
LAKGAKEDTMIGVIVDVINKEIISKEIKKDKSADAIPMGGREYAAKGIDLDKKLMQCRVKEDRNGPYKRVLFQRNPMHDGSWDRLMWPTTGQKTGSDQAVFKKIKQILSYIPGFNYLYKTKGTPLSGLQWKLVLKRDEVNGRAEYKVDVEVESSGCSGCGCGGSTTKTVTHPAIKGQLELFAGIKADTPVVEGLRLFYSHAGKDPKKQFEGREALISHMDDKLLVALKSLATVKNEAELRVKIYEISEMAYKYKSGDNDAVRGLADGAALLALAAMQEIARSRTKPDGVCNKDGTIKYNGDISFWKERANVWLKVARRLAHGGDAMFFEREYERVIVAADPIFDETQSAFVCLNEKGEVDKATQAMMTFSVGGDTGFYISGPVKAALKSSYEAAFGCLKKVSGGGGCGRGKIRIKWHGKMRCLKRCVPDYGRYYNGSCKPKPRWRPPMRPVVMGMDNIVIPGAGDD